MATIAGRMTVPRPGTDAALLPYGLFKVANGPLPLPDHASVGGLVFQSPYCKQPSGYDVNCPPASKAAALVGSYDTVTGDPFVVLAGMECGALSGDERGPDAYSRDLVVQALMAGEQRLVERIFSEGLNGQAKALNDAGGTLLAGAAANVVEAFGRLEDAFADVYGLPAILHVPLAAAAAVKANHLVEKDSAGIWRTVAGNAVSFGAYTGADEADVVPASPATTLYITGQVSVWRNDIWVSPWAESIDKTTNQIHRFAERTYVVTYECAATSVAVTNMFACC